jgi:hypothetical protein
VICAHAPLRGNDIASQVATVFRSIFVPPMADRSKELGQIIDAYARDAITSLGGELAATDSLGGELTPTDRDWIARYASGSLDEIEMATRRFIALHACKDSVTLAAKYLGITHGSLSDWLSRRKRN